MRSTRPTQFFSEIIRGTRWKERQRQYHQDKGDVIFGPENLLCWIISALFLLLFFLVGPDGRDAYYESWRWLIHGLFMLIVSGLMGQYYCNAKNQNIAYWLIFMCHCMIFLSGMMLGGIIYSRFL